MNFGVSFSVAEAVATFSRLVVTDELDQAARFIVEIEHDEHRGPSFVFLMALMMCGAIGNHAGYPSWEAIPEEAYRDTEIKAFCEMVDRRDVDGSITTWQAMQYETQSTLILALGTAIGELYRRVIGRSMGAQCGDPTCPVHGTVQWN